MVKVTKGALGGERPKGYESYTSNYGVGPSVAVRRKIPTTALPTVGTSLAQTKQKDSFAAATKTYSKFNALQKDFFKRCWQIDKTTDSQGREKKRILKARQLAIKDIARTISTSGEKYLKPLGFCICAIDLEGNPAPEHELNITSEKLRKFTYKEQNDEFACFPPSSLSPRYEPYHLFYTDAADYCLLTAEQIHKIKTLPVIRLQKLWERTRTWSNHYGSYENLYKFNFQALHIFEEELEVSFIWESSFSSTGYIEMWLYCGGSGHHIITKIYPGENIKTVVNITVRNGCRLVRDWRSRDSGHITLTATETIAIADENPC
jgi:hypothetical protein